MLGPPRNPAQLVIGGTFNDGRYRILRCIARGGMGAVYEAEHLQTKRVRALKVMLPSVVESEEARARFKLEATVVSSVRSDHIAEVIDAGVDDESGMPFIVMELLEGHELADVVFDRGALPYAEVVTYLTHAAYALERTHAAGIVHRDLKPENLFVTRRDDGSPCVKLLDFGIAKVLGDAKTQHTQGIVGTPLYISPEQVHGEVPVSPRTDVYALAHIAYTLLVGEPYWTPEEEEAETIMPLFVTIMRGHQQKAVARAWERQGVRLPPAFDAWFDRGASLLPDDRFATPLELVIALGQVFGEGVQGSTAQFASAPSVRAEADVALAQTARHETPAAPEPLVDPPTGASTAIPTVRNVQPDKARRSGLWAVVAAVLVTGGALAGGVVLWRGHPSPSPASTGVEELVVDQPSPGDDDSQAPESPTSAPSVAAASGTPASSAPAIPSSAPSVSASASASAPKVVVPRRPVRPQPPKAPPPPGGWVPLVPDR